MNRIPDVERIQHAMRLGWPEGTSELHKEVPVLLKRIEELEAALVPFARVATSEAKAAAPANLVHVYLKDCVKAFDALDSRQGLRKQNDGFFSQPAEG
jgi:hypothetical protein